MDRSWRFERGPAYRFTRRLGGRAAKPGTVVSVRLALIFCTLLGCTTIHLEEEHAFDAKRTVSEQQISELGAQRTRFSIPIAEDMSLSAWWLRRMESRGTLLYFGGNGYLMVNSYHIMQGILQGPVDVLTVDYRGYGQSDGTPSIADLKADALAVYDYAVASGVPKDAIAVHGHSLGSFVALWVASKRDVAAVILETPVTHVEDLLGHLAPWWSRLFIGFDVDPALLAENNRARIRKLRRPLLILAGEEDKVAHPDMAKTLFEEAASEDKHLEVFPGGGHNDLPLRSDYRASFQSFLERIFPSPSTVSPKIDAIDAHGAPE
ncbi:MAG: alpha/beta fold hydrolase [Myxococcota bacterium]